MPEVLEDTNATLQVMSILHDATKGQPVLHNHSKPAGGLARSYLKHSKHIFNHFKNTHKNVTVEVVVKMFVLYLNTRIAEAEQEAEESRKCSSSSKRKIISKDSKYNFKLFKIIFTERFVVQNVNTPWISIQQIRIPHVLDERQLAGRHWYKKPPCRATYKTSNKPNYVA